MSSKFDSQCLAHDAIARKRERARMKIVNPRFWGPCQPEEASDLVEAVLSDSTIPELFRRYAIGEIDGRELGYCIELSFESEEARLRNAAAEGDLVEEEGA
jgi:hypothetical protein